MQKFLIQTWLVCICFSLIGCSNLQWPPPGQTKSTGLDKRKAVIPSPLISKFDEIPVSGVVRVKKGDTLFILSRRYGVSFRAIIEANHLKPPYRLRIGESLILPRPRFHKIVRGESLYQISRRYGFDVYELARINRLKSPFRIYVGQKLVLPSFNVMKPKTFALEKKNLQKSSKMKKNKIAGVVRKHSKNILRSNRSSSKNRKNVSISNKPKSVSVPDVKTSGRFDWPVRGRLSSIFGSKGQGLHNDGINIMAPRGSSVRAADAGVVAYAGNELRGFGNLLLIKHSGGWVTAYAHNEKLLVKRGDIVAKGQVVAKVGASGNVIQPQLHFEVRKGKRAINPLMHLKRITVNIKNEAVVLL